MAKARKIPAFIYNISSLGQELMPRVFWRWHRHHTLRGWEQRPDADYIRSRVEFYCRRTFVPNSDAVKASDIKRGNVNGPSAYVFDLRRYLRAYPKNLLINFFAGDTFVNPPVPTIIKTRRLDDSQDNGVLFNLNHRRHFLPVVEDDIPFRQKHPMLVWRGAAHAKKNRERFLELYKDSPLMNIADTQHPFDAEGNKSTISVTDHFRYQYVLVLEGNDVASCLQWVMASNCVPVMCRPTVEGWLMHSRMEPGKHYIEISPDLSDIEAKLQWYISHPEEAEKISEESKRWAAQFTDKKRESIISYLILDKYFGIEPFH